MKKIISLILCLIMAMAVVPMSSHAKQTKRVSGRYTYIVKADKTAEIVKYKQDKETKVGVLKIPSKLDGYKVTSIGKRAFKANDDCDFHNYDDPYHDDADYDNDPILDYWFEKIENGLLRFRKIVIPNTVTKIGKYAFENCYKTKNIVVPKSVKTIGEGAFSGCCALQKIKIPKGVTVIEKSTFEYCMSLKAIKIPASVTKIKANAFEDCGIESIVIPKTVTEIGEYAFDNCHLLSDATVPLLSDYMFYKCSRLVSVSVTTNITKINIGTFARCYSLSNLDLPESVTVIEEGVFEDCDSLDFTFENSSFGNSQGYSYMILPDNTVEILEYRVGEIDEYQRVEIENLVIPETLDGHKVSVIGSNPFSNYYLHNVVIPNGVTKIKSNAFFNYGGKSIVIPDSVTEIGDSAFRESDNLEEFVFPEGCLEIGNSVFVFCENLKRVTLPKNLKAISESMFYSCEALESINLPEGVTEIGDGAFQMSGLKTIQIPKGVTCIGDLVFAYSSLEDIELPEGLTKIGYDAFGSCKFKTIKLPDSLTEIGAAAFHHNEFLESIEIPQSVTKIGKNVFEGCKSLKTISLPDSITKISKKAFLESGIEKITLPASCEVIEKEAFSLCKNLSEVNLPQNLKLIKNNAFMDCPKLKSITVPKSTVVEKDAICSVDSFHETWEIKALLKARKGFKIYGYKNSDAQRYARDNGLDFVNVKTQKVIKGTKPKRVTNATASVSCDGKKSCDVYVSYKSVPNARWYILEYSYNRNMKNAKTKIDYFFSRKSSGFEVDNRKPGKTLYYRVKAVNGKDGKFSKIFSVKLEK